MFNGTVRRYVSSLSCRGEEIDIALMKLQPATGQLSKRNSISINCSALTGRWGENICMLRAHKLTGCVEFQNRSPKTTFCGCIGGCRWWLPGLLLSLWGIYDVTLPILPFGLWRIVSFGYPEALPCLLSVPALTNRASALQPGDLQRSLQHLNQARKHTDSH